MTPHASDAWQPCQLQPPAHSQNQLTMLVRRHLRTLVRRASSTTPQKQLQLQNNRLRLKRERPASYADACATLEEQRSKPLDEATYSVLIRNAVEAGDVDGGQQILERMTRNNVRRKRRAYAPLLAALSHNQQKDEVEALWAKMVRDGVKPDQMDLARLFAAAPSHDILQRMADDAARCGAFEIKMETAKALESGPWRARYERVDTETGITSHGQLRRLALDADDKVALRKALLDRAEAGARPDGVRLLKEFGDRWDEHVYEDSERRKREGRKQAVRVCVDGANVAWYGQNHSRGGFSHAQLDHAMSRLSQLFDDEAYEPTLFLPRKHVKRLHGHRRKLVESWSSFLIDVPRGVDDDWFWMRATLSDESEHAFAVTNDAARDHHLAHVAPRAFRRWLRRHVLRFEFARDGDDAEVLLRTKGGQRSAGQHFVLGEPPAFSTECQRVGDAWLLPLQTKHSKDWNRRSRTWLSLHP